MGLLANLRVLIGSDIGDVVRDVRKQVAQLRTDFEELAELTELRYRRLNKRARDESRNEGRDAPAAPQGGPVHPRLAALRARRAGMNGRDHATVE